MRKSIGILSLIIIFNLVSCMQPETDLVSATHTNQDGSTAALPTLKPGTQTKHTLTVFAAASLTGAFQEIGKIFEISNPGVTINFNFAGSQILRTQIEQGGAADVFASADHKNMDLLISDNLVNANAYQDFVTNQLIVILPPRNPANVRSLGDLTRPRLKLVLADTTVPAGNYARQVLLIISKDPMYGADFSANVLANVVSNETDVKQVVTKVELGEADAGIVYVSDAIATPSLFTISIPDKFNIVASYPIAILTNSPEPKLASAFVSYIMSPAGQAVMSEWGFSAVLH